MDTLYRTPAGRAAVLAAYADRLAALPLEVESRSLSTSAGETHVLLGGPADHPAVVLVHGANADAAQMAHGLGFLAATHRCVFVDVPGEPNRSSETRPPRGNGSLGRWMGDVLDALELRNAAMLGISGGGYVVVRAALAWPERVDRAVLVAPEGFTPYGALPEPTAANAGEFVEAISAPGSGLPAAALEIAAAHMRLVFQHVEQPLNLGPLFSDEELAALAVPVFLVAGGRDAVFAGHEILRRARANIADLRACLLLEHSNHIHVDYFRGETLERMLAFLAPDPAHRI